MMLLQSSKEIKVDELGYRISVPKNYTNDKIRGGTYLWIKVDETTKAGVQRWPSTFAYSDFRKVIKEFSNCYNGEIKEGEKSNDIHQTINDNKENYFKFIETEFYNFYIWGESLEILSTILEGIRFNDKILNNHYKNRLDYPIQGSEIIEFGNKQNIFFRDSVNIFQMNIDTSYYINPYLMISDGNIENRYKNIYSLSEIPKHINTIRISIDASDKTGEHQLNYRKEFKVE